MAKGRNTNSSDMFHTPLEIRTSSLSVNMMPQELNILTFSEDFQRIRNTVTHPKKTMLTWPKQLECSAFWGMMKLLEIKESLHLV